MEMVNTLQKPTKNTCKFQKKGKKVKFQSAKIIVTPHLIRNIFWKKLKILRRYGIIL